MLRWAIWISAKRAVLQAMMTEAGVECIKVTRLNESEQSEACDRNNSVETFLKTCIVIFEHKRCQHIGFLKFMLKALKNPIHFVFPDHSTKVLSREQVTQQILDECYGHVQEWMHLMVKILAAENPHFEITTALVPLLSLKHPWQATDHGADFERSLDRVCKILKYDNNARNRLKSQLADVQPYATHLLDSGPETTENAA